MFEHRSRPLLPRHLFIWRQINSLAFGCLLLAVALGIGVCGYHWIAGLAWVDALLDASMILGGMGPVSTLTSDAAKVFASAYALFSGIVFIGLMAIILAPAVHRMLHKFHVDEKEED